MASTIIRFVFIVIPIIIFSQNQIKGTIYNIEKDFINNATVLLKKERNQLIEAFAQSDEKGMFSFSINEEVDYEVEIKAKGYISETFQVKPNVQSVFTLIKGENEIKEVVITKKKPFVIKNDTVTYNVDAYKDASDKKVEDLLKKLPGIKVDEGNGQITYKNKTVEAVTLDGDDLFGFNYTIGTKNMNIDMVEHIEAIDNYSENPLLKGIENSNRVALNLKLKKGKTDLSGSVHAAHDLDDSYHTESTLLGINKKLKSFGVASYNNVGINPSPFDYFSMKNLLAQSKELDYKTQKIISEKNNRISIFDNNKTNVNQALFGSINSLYKVNKKTSARINYHFYNDRIKAQNIVLNHYTFDENPFSTSDISSSTKKPNLHNGELKIKHNLNKTSLLEYNLKLSKESIKTTDNLLSNNKNQYNTLLNSDNLFIKNNLLYTKKFNSKNALQFNLIYSQNNIPQTFTLDSSPFLINESVSKNVEQKSEFRKTYLESKVTYFTKIKRSKLGITIGVKNENTPFESSLKEDNILVNNYKNNLEYNLTSFFGKGSIDVYYNKWILTPTYHFDIINRSLKDNISLNDTDFTYSNSLNLRRKLSENSSVSLLGSYYIKPFNERYLFSNEILINNRNLISNQPSFKLQKTQRYSLKYSLFDLLNQIFINTEISYQKNKNNFLSNYTFTNNYTLTNFYNSPTGNENWSFSLNTSWYLQALRTKIDFNTNYSINHYKNNVNNSELRNNTSNGLISGLKLNRTFLKNIKFENTFSINYSEYKSNQTISTNIDVINKLKTTYSFENKWFAEISFDYYHPNKKNNKKTYSFLNFEASYEVNKKIEFNINANNLLNKKLYTEYQNSDYNSISISNNLLHRSILFGFNYNF